MNRKRVIIWSKEQRFETKENRWLAVIAVDLLFYLQIPFLHLYINADFLGGVPHEFHAIIGRGRLTNVYHPITKGNIDLEQSFTGSCALPCEHLFPFSVLKSPLVEANAYCRLKQKRWMSLQRRCSTVWVTHIFRTSRTFMSSFGLLRVKHKGDVLIIRQWYIGDTMMIIMIIIAKFCLPVVNDRQEIIATIILQPVWARLISFWETNTFFKMLLPKHRRSPDLFWGTRNEWLSTFKIFPRYADRSPNFFNLISYDWPWFR